MNLIPVKTPQLIKGIFPKYVWNMPDDQKVIYLTFDDGPTPEITHWTLDLLKSYHAKATFFCIGNNIQKHPQIFKEILKDGHAVGNHTFHHLKGWKTDTDVYIEDVLKTQEIIDFENPKSKSQIPNPIDDSSSICDSHQSAINNLQSLINNQMLFRPPYGKIKSSQGKQLINLGYKIIMWDVLAFDWKNSLSEEQCANNVISKAGAGSIVVFHDSVKASTRMKYALTKTLEHFSKEGYQFKTL
ncbi:polysaccharide deacetylase family protein [Gelidibacter sp.]|uniref:polysaccharide deacetylase family protein n=1 Tax=Gelidibacter sp. TaxID=2018083 RepID=UPI0032637B40